MGRALALAAVVAFVGSAYGSSSPVATAWRTTGPEGGDVFSLVSSSAAPDTVYAGTSDGAYRSTNFGGSWRPISSGLPKADRGRALAVDPGDPNLVYAWSGARLWRSVDGGGRWRPLGPARQAMWGVIRIAVAPSAPSTLYALAGGYAKPAIWRSDDSGRSWKRVWQRPSGDGGAALDIAVDPTSARRLYLGWLSGPVDDKLEKFAGGGLTVSADAGRTWRREISDDDIHSLAVDPDSQHAYAGGATGRVYRRDEPAGRWRPVARLAVRDRVTALAVDPKNASTVYALTSRGVHRSNDRGATWRFVDRAARSPRVYTWGSHSAAII